jgi:hypothetical protein
VRYVTANMIHLPLRAQFHDFTATVEDDGADAWFDSQMAQVADHPHLSGHAFVQTVQ